MHFFRRPGFLAIIVLLLLLGFSRRGILQLDQILSPFLRAFVTPFYEFARAPATNLERENTALRAALRDAVGTRITETIVTERAEERATIEAQVQARSLPPPIIATVLTRIEEDGRHFFLLDRGARDGVTPHAGVFIGKGVLVGRIAEVRSSTALLALLTERKERVSVMREEGGTPIGVIEGRGGDDMLSLTLIPREEILAPKAVLITSGLDSGIPRGFTVGIVRDVAPVHNSPWQRADVEPLVRSADVRTVGILSFPNSP